MINADKKKEMKKLERDVIGNTRADEAVWTS